MKKTNRKLGYIIFISIVLLSIILIVAFVRNIFLNGYSTLSKEERVRNMISGYGSDKMNESAEAREIQACLSKYSNWDNLFLSENFKMKYKNRKYFLSDVNNISRISNGIDRKYGKNAVIIYAEKKSGIFDMDESDDITTVYHFRYVMDNAGEIDDLILLEKYDVYTLNGERVDEIAENG